MAIQGVKGIGEKRAAALEQMGISSLEDALYLLPSGYMDFTHAVKISDLQHGQKALVCAEVTGTGYPSRGRSGVSMLMARCSDGTGTLNLIWFNQPYMFNRLKKGEEYRLYGAVQLKDGRRYLINPLFEPVSGDSMVGIRPVYSIPKGIGISQSVLRGVIRIALDECGAEDLFPASIREKYSLAQRQYALENIHFPSSEAALRIAKRTVAFQELVMLMIGLSMQRERVRARTAHAISTDGLREKYRAALPFPLTGAQERALEEIEKDVRSGYAMNRLLQGDVGSGKTAVAFYCAFLAHANNGQCVIMAPTEILARQHFLSFAALFPDIPCVYIHGKMKKKERDEAVQAVQSGQASVIVGTHAVLSEKITYRNLLFAVTDEQHRFGVAHRAGLAHKGDNPNMLVLSATPIPRTLALVLYNDLDLSVLDELPPGRQKITTAIIPPRREEDLFDYIAKCADSGVQSYVVCPLVEENEDYAARSAQEMYELMCQKTAPDNIGLIHGRMSAEEKQRVMDGFCGGDIKILVATTVIEVGVNVPSAVNMVIVDAERFGLAQLHQLRGRVGRGSAKSYCFLLSGEDNERLEIMTKSNDGFEIAEKDLMLRGPGDYLGQRQSGMPGTDFSALFADMELVMQAKEAASCIAGESRYSVLYEALRASLSAENDNMSKNITYN